LFGISVTKKSLKVLIHLVKLVLFH
jgi:hypothetical protein